MAWLDNPDGTPWFREGLEHSARAVTRIQQMAVEKNFGLLIVVYPYPKMMAQKKLRNDYTLFWEKFSAERRIPFLDLSPLFEEPGKPAKKVYAENFIAGDFHWNARGSTRVAEALLPWIEKNLPPAASPAGKVSTR